MLSIFLKNENTEHVNGRLNKVGSGIIEIENNNEKIEIPLDSIQKAKPVIQW